MRQRKNPLQYDAWRALLAEHAHPPLYVQVAVLVFGSDSDTNALYVDELLDHPRLNGLVKDDNIVALADGIARLVERERWRGQSQALTIQEQARYVAMEVRAYLRDDALKPTPDFSRVTGQRRNAWWRLIELAVAATDEEAPFPDEREAKFRDLMDTYDAESTKHILATLRRMGYAASYKRPQGQHAGNVSLPPLPLVPKKHAEPLVTAWSNPADELRLRAQARRREYGYVRARPVEEHNRPRPASRGGREGA